MGKLLGKTQGGYSDIENGRQKINGNEIKLICQEFNIDPNIFTTDLPESEWFRFLNKPQTGAKPELQSEQKPFETMNLSLLLIEKQRIEKELQAFREENEQLKLFINEHCGK